MPRRPYRPLAVSAPRRRWLESQVASGRFHSIGAAADFYIRQAETIQREKERVEHLLLEGLDSGPAQQVDERWWADFRAEARARLARRARRRSA